MCGRYSITSPAEAMRRLFRFAGPLPNLPPRYNVAPTQQVPIVRRARGDGKRELAQVRWGLIPFWAKDATIGYKLINARAEGIAEKRSFEPPSSHAAAWCRRTASMNGKRRATVAGRPGRHRRQQREERRAGVFRGRGTIAEAEEITIADVLRSAKAQDGQIL